jgi:hypothetical protein
MNWCELTVGDQWANFVLMGESFYFLVVVAFVTEQNTNSLSVALDQRWSNLAIMPSYRYQMKIENCVDLRID